MLPWDKRGGTLFAAFYWIVDVKMWRGWTFPLRVVDMNAITIYLLQRIVDFDAVSRSFVGGLVGDYGVPIVRSSPSK